MKSIADKSLTDHAFDLCARLIRIDTTNPPGNEIEAAKLVADNCALLVLPRRFWRVRLEERMWWRV